MVKMWKLFFCFKPVNMEMHSWSQMILLCYYLACTIHLPPTLLNEMHLWWDITEWNQLVVLTFIQLFKSFRLLTWILKPQLFNMPVNHPNFLLLCPPPQLLPPNKRHLYLHKVQVLSLKPSGRQARMAHRHDERRKWRKPEYGKIPQKHRKSTLNNK